MHNLTNSLPTTTSPSDVVKITERANSGVHSSSLSRIAIGYVLSGTKYIYHNDTSHSIEEGDIFLLEAGFHYEENTIGANGRFEQILFFISPEKLQQVIFGLNVNYGLTFTSRHACTKCTSRNFAYTKADMPLRNFFIGIDISLRKTGQLHNDIGQRIKLNELIYLVLSNEDSCIKRKVLRASDAEMGQFVNIVYDNIFNDISIETLAEYTNRSLTSFKKEFKRIFNTPPHQWIIEQRLDRARILLTSTNRTVSEISIECAFANVSHFIKLFKQRYNETPASFRNKHSAYTEEPKRIAAGEF